MSAESIRELTKEVEKLTKTVNGHNDVIKKGLNRTNFALNSKETKINGDEILKEIETSISSRLNTVNKVLNNIDEYLKG